MSYNLLNYSSTDASRDQNYRTILRHAQPDLLVVQEITSQAAVDNFYSNVVSVVFPGQFSKGTFIDGPDTDNGVYYRSTKINFAGNTPIRTALRDISQFTLVHTASTETLRVYSVHLKASSGSSNEALRVAEVDSLRKATNQLPAGKCFMVMGDFNIYSSSEAAYQKLLQDNPTDDGHFVDAISITGTWNSGAYASFHTQSPRVRSFGGGATGGLDDRFDMILFSRAISQAGGRVSYVTNSMTAVGNDGLHYNDSINRMPNNAVPDSVAYALHYASDHLPVTARFVFPTAPVPIQLAYFNAQIVGSSSVVLRWGTISETNNYGFDIQRRATGSNDFETLPNSFVAGHGTTHEPHDYAFTDATPTAGESQYRLKQIDLDGAIHYTDPVSITITSSVAENAPSEFMLYQNYPNPFNPTTTIRYSIPGGTYGHTSLRVFDLLGREIATLANEPRQSGEHAVVFDAAGLASGVYLYRLQAGDYVATKKLILLR